MPFTLPFLSRREFIRRTGALSAAISAASGALQARASARRAPTGKKGHTYPSQKKNHRDAKSGVTVWRLTDTPGHTTAKLYYTNRSATPDSRWLIYSSDRASGREHGFDLFKLDLRTGESVQLTESGDVIDDTPDISYDGRRVYYITENHSLRAVDLESLQEREILKFEPHVEADHAVSVSPDDKFVIVAPLLEKKKKLGYQFHPIAIRSALITVNTATGEQKRIVDGNSPLGHVAYSPKDPNLILFSIHGRWEEVHRPWLIHGDGSKSRWLFDKRQGEGVGHEFWGASGTIVYATRYGGAQPQGVWAVDINGTNERCVLAGANIAHGCASDEEDRFVVDELYADTSAIWIARKGSNEAKLLCSMAKDWFEQRPDGTVTATRYHPHPRFLSNGTAVLFNSAGDVYMAAL